MSGVSYEEFSASPLADCFVYITSNGHQNRKETEPHIYFVKLSNIIRDRKIVENSKNGGVGVPIGPR